MDGFGAGPRRGRIKSLGGEVDQVRVRENLYPPVKKKESIRPTGDHPRHRGARVKAPVVGQGTGQLNQEGPET